MVPPPGGVSTEMTPGYLMDRKSKDSTNPISFLFDFMRKYCACVWVCLYACMHVYVHVCSCTICVCSCFCMCVFGKVREQSCLLWFKPLKYSHTSPISSMYTLATPYIVRGRCTVKSGVVFGELSPNAPIVLGQYSRNPSSLQISNTLWNPRILT